MEIPKPDPSLVARLQEHDKSLGLRFNTDECLWEVTETLRTGLVSHCFYWHDGDWKNRKYKALPHSAEPLLTKLGIIDWGRGRANPMERYRAMTANGQEKRAAMMQKAEAEAKLRLRDYAAWLQRNAERLARLYALGGQSRARAIRARVDAVRDLYGGKLPASRY